jgi:hypothetical protein
VPKQNVAVKLLLPAATSNPKSTIDDVIAPVSKSACTSAPDASASDQSPTSIKDVDRVPVSAMASKSAHTSIFGGGAMSRKSKNAERLKLARAFKEEQRRKSTKVWFPKACDLPLTHIPEDVRSQIRNRLDLWLRRMTHAGGNTQRVGIKGGDCYRVAQALVLTAKDPSVKYVEGMWGHGSAHAWATVDGYRVDLINELYIWRDNDNERLYEPYREFSEAELREAFVEENGYDDETISYYECKNDGVTVSFSIVHQRWLDDGNTVGVHSCHDFDGPGNLCTCKDHSVMCEQWEICECEDQAAMASAFKRLREHIDAEGFWKSVAGEQREFVDRPSQGRRQGENK